MSNSFTESIVEEAALGWLDELGYSLVHGPALDQGRTDGRPRSEAKVALREIDYGRKQPFFSQDMAL